MLDLCVSSYTQTPAPDPLFLELNDSPNGKVLINQFTTVSLQLHVGEFDLAKIMAVKTKVCFIIHSDISRCMVSKI
jgi:hypothetical protein